MPSLTAFYSNPRANSVFLSLLTAMSWSFCDLQSGVTAEAGIDIQLINLVFSAAFFVTSICVAFADPEESPRPIRQWKEGSATIALGLCGIVDNYVYVQAQKLIPVGDVALLSDLCLVYIPFFDSLWRRRLPTAPQFVGIVLSIFGVVLVTQPTFIFGSSLELESSRDATGYLLGLTTGASLTIDAMLVSIFKEIPVSNWMLSIGAGLFLCGAIGATVDGGVGVAPDSLVALSLTTMALLSAVGQFACVLSNKTHTPTLTTLVTSLQVPLTYAWGWIWLNQDMNWIKILGVVLVFASVTIVICDVKRSERRDHGQGLVMS